MNSAQLAQVKNFTQVTRTLSFTSGKGGVGKTSLAANISIQLAREGNQVLLLDGDVSMANLDILFGARFDKNLSHVLSGEATVEQVIRPIDRNLSLLPGGSGVRALQNMTDTDRRHILDQISMLPTTYDFMIIDTAPGIDNNVLALNAAAHEIHVIVTPDASSLTDAYALIKVLNRDFKIEKFKVIANQVRDEDEGLGLYQRLSDVANKFLFISLDYLGSVPMDPYMRQASRTQKPLIKVFDHAPATLAVKNLVRGIQAAKPSESLHGGLQAFWTQLVGLAC